MDDRTDLLREAIGVIERMQRDARIERFIYSVTVLIALWIGKAL